MTVPLRLIVIICILLQAGVGFAQSPAQVGQWHPVFNLPWRPVHSILLPTGKVLIYANKINAPWNEQFLWDPDDNSLSPVPAFGFDSFCSGHVLTADGRVFITGGTVNNIMNVGTDRATFYDPVTHAFSPVPDMNAGRFYPSMVTLANGDVVTMSGDMTPGVRNPIPQVFQMATGTWRDLTSASLSLPLYPAAFLAPNGKVFVATDPSRYLDTAGAGQWTFVADRNATRRDDEGSASMYDDGKVIYTGGGGWAGEIPGPYKTAEVIDLTDSDPDWSYVASMPAPRRQQNTTLLPDGRVLVTGGSSSVGFDVNDGGKPAIVWDPDDPGYWTTWATEAKYRGYHSEAVLLPDARVASIGGDTSSNLQIFSPPYLFNENNQLAARPTVTSAPLAVHYGDTFRVETPDAAAVLAAGGQVNWLRPSAVTHTKNMNQRINRLDFAAAPGGLDVTAPSDPNLAPPGDYMLFLINDAGVPSMASWIRLLIEAPVTGLVERWRLDVDGRSGSLGNDAALINGASVITDSERGDVLSCDGSNDYAEVNNTLSQSFSWAAWIRTSASSPTGDDAAQGDVLIAALANGGNEFVVSILNNKLAFYAGDSGQSLIGSTVLNDNEWHHIAVTADSDQVHLYVDGQPDGNSSTGVATALTAAANVHFCGSPSSNGYFAGQMDHIQQYDRAITVNEALQLAAIGGGTDPLTVEDIVSPPIRTNATAQYTAVTSGGADLEYHWIFGDGEESIGPSPTVSHSYDEPGVYSVTLIVSDLTNVETTVENFFQAVHLPPTANRPTQSSSIIYEQHAGNDRVWNVNPDNDTVSVFDAVTHQKLAEIAVGDSPRSLAQRFGRVWVTNKHSANISVIDTATLTVLFTVDLPHRSQPHGIVFDPAGNAAYVALEALGEVHKLHAGLGTLQDSADLGPDVRHLSVTSDGSRVLVSRFVTPKLPGEETATPLTEVNGEMLGGEVLVLNAANMNVMNTVILQHNDNAMEGAGHQHGANGHAAARGIPNYLGAPALSPDGQSAWVPSKQDNIKRGIFRDGAMPMHDATYRAVLSRIEMGGAAGSETEDYGSRVDHDNSAVPSAAAFGRYGNYLFIALEGSRVVRVVNVYDNYEVSEINVGRAPQGVVVSPDGLTLYTHNFMDRSISVHDVSDIVNEHHLYPQLVTTLDTVAVEAMPTIVLQGKQLFYDAADARLSSESYISCAGCHNDGDDDGRVWDFTGFGEGLRNTTDLRGKAGHGPLHWTGNFDEVQDFEAQIRGLAQGYGLMSNTDFDATSNPLGAPKAGRSADLDALAAYVNSLTEADPSPHVNPDGSLTAAAVAGRAVFLAHDCGSCHAPNAYTDSALGVLHAIEPLRASSGKRLGQTLTGFDTPTLNGVWSSPPYLHDGSAETLADAVAAHQYTTIGAADTGNLVAFLEQLDGQDAIAPTVPSGLTAIAVSTAQIDLDWNASSDDSLPVTYNLYEAGATEPLRSNLGGTALLLPVDPGRTYTFVVRAVDGFGNISAPSNTASATTLGDDDLDGMSNAFEDAHEGLDRNNPNDANTDLDGDGLTNLEEFLAEPSLDPTSADSDGDGLGDAMDAQPLAAMANVCTGGTADIATMAEPIADVRICAARLAVDVMSPTVVSDSGHLTVIAPQIRVGAGVSSGEIIMINADPCPGCTNSVAPEVSDTMPSDNATLVAVDSNLEITFSEPVSVSADWFQISCPSGLRTPSGSGGTSVVVSDGDPVFTLDPLVDFANNETCNVTVFEVGVTDDDPHDPPDAMEADYTFSFTTVPVYDFGDAPDPTYPVLLGNDGARHILESGLWLGSVVDAELDGWQSSTASGDDSAGDDDEDGITFTSVLTDDIDATVTVSASIGGGRLSAWVDFNQNGIWEGNEQVFTDENLSVGLNELTFEVPENAGIGETFARFRLSSASGLSSFGEAPDGEVEDYRVTIVDNVPPELDGIDIGVASIDEGASLSFTVTASDVDTPVQNLTFSLEGAAEGMTIDPHSGLFSWTPGEDMGDATHEVTITVTDDGQNPANLSDSETVSITVNETNRSPTLDPIGPLSVDEGVELTFTPVVTDPDLPAQNVAFELDAIATLNGMEINPNTGEFSWTPLEDQGLYSYPATITVTDDGVNPDALFDTEEFWITVNEANVPPVLEAIEDKTVIEGTSLNFSAIATDADVPGQSLTFRLDAVAESYGMSIDAGTGLFSWTPTPAQVGSTFSATITVTDDGVNPPNLSDSKTFSVTVLEHFSISVTISGLAGTGLVLQNNGGDDLDIAAAGNFTFATAVANLSSYEVTVLNQPTGPSQTCTVTNGSGTVAGGNVTDVMVSCTTNSYTVGGTLNGLSSNSVLVLRNNGTDYLTVTGNGNFTFANVLADLSSYDVIIHLQIGNPPQTCTVTNGSGVLNGANVDNVLVDCVLDP